MRGNARDLLLMLALAGLGRPEDSESSGEKTTVETRVWDDAGTLSHASLVDRFDLARV